MIVQVFMQWPLSSTVSRLALATGILIDVWLEKVCSGVVVKVKKVCRAWSVSDCEKKAFIASLDPEAVPIFTSIIGWITLI